MPNQRTLTININVTAAQAAQAIQGVQAALAGLNGVVNQNSNAQKQNNVVTQQATVQSKAWQQSIDQARRNAYAMTIAGYQLAAAGRAVTDSLKATVDVAGDVDYAMRRAAGALGILDDASDMFRSLGDNIQQTAIETKLFDAETIGKSYYYWGSAVGSVVENTEDLKNLQAELLPIMKAAAITETDYQTSIKGVTGILQQFQMPMTRAADVTEMLFYATQKTANEWPDLIEAFKMVGPVAFQAGLSFEDVVTVLSKLGDVGIRGTTAGRAIRQMLRQLMRETPKATKALDAAFMSSAELGKSFKDIIFPQGKFAGFQTLISSLATATKGLNDEQKGYLFNSIATAAELPTLISLVNMQQQGVEKVGKSYEILNDQTDKLDFTEAGETFAKSWELMSNSIKGVLGELKNKLQPVIIDVGKAVVANFKPAAEAIGRMAENIHAFAEANPTVFRAIVGFTMLAGSLSLTSGMVLLLMGGVRLLAGTVLPNLVEWLFHSQVQMALYGTTTQAATTTNYAFATSLGILRGRLALAGAGVRNLAVGSGGMGILGGIFQKLSLSAVGLYSRLLMLGESAAAFARAAAPVAVIVTILAGTFSELLKRMGGGIDIFNAIGKVGNFIFDSMKNVVAAFEKVTKFLFKGGQAIGFWIAFFADLIGEIPLLSDALGLLGDVIGGIGDIIGKVFGGIGEIFDWVMSKADEAMNAYDAYKKKIAREKAIAQNPFLADIYSDLDSEQSKKYDDMEARRLAAVEQTWANVRAANESGLAQTQAELFDDLRNSEVATTGALDVSLVNPFTKAFDEIVKKARDAGQEIPQSLTTALNSTQLANTAMPVIQKMYDTLVGTGSEKGRIAAREVMLNFANEFYHSGVEGVVPAATGIIDFAIAAMEDKNPVLRQIGQNAMANMALGYQDGGNSALLPTAAYIINNLNTLIASNDKNQRALGYRGMAEYAMGLANNEPNKALQAVLLSAVQMLQSGEPAMQAEGANAIIGYANGMISQMPVIGAIVAEMMAKIRYALAHGLDTEKIEAFYMKKIRRVMASSSIAGTKALPKINYDNPTLPPLPKVGGTGYGGSYTTPSASGSGAAGATSDQQSPLQKALEVAEQGVRLYESLRKLEGVKLTDLVKKTMGEVANAISTSINISAGYAKKVSKADLETVAKWAEGAGTLMTTIGGAVESFKALADYKGVSQDKIRQIVRDMVFAVADMIAYGKQFSANSMVVATEFAQTAQTVASAYGEAFSSFTSLGEYTRVSRKTFDDIAADMREAVLALSKVVTAELQRLAQTGAEFSDVAGRVVSGIAGAFSAFKDLSSYERVLPTVLANIIADIVVSVQQMSAASKAFNFSEADAARIIGFADVTEKVMGAIDATWATFNKTIQFVDQFRERPNLSQVFEDMKSSIAKMRDIASLYTNDTISKVGALADTTAKIAAAIDAFFGIGKNASQDPGVLGQMVAEALGAIAVVVSNFATSFGQSGADMITAFVAGVRSQEPTLLAEMLRVRDILGVASGGTSIVVNSDNPTLTIVHVIKDPDGALRNANSAEVAQILSGEQFISNLWSATLTQ